MPAVQKAVAACGKPVQTLFIQELGGVAKTTAKGVLIAQEMAIQASRLKPQECDAGDIVLGLKCGSSDTTSGLWRRSPDAARKYSAAAKGAQ